MTSVGSPLTPSAIRALLLGSGELGKEVVIELQRLGVETIAVDRYDHAPAMQVAHRSHTINMLEARELTAIIEAEKPDLIIPEIEAIATDTLMDLEERGMRVIPSAKAVHTTMNRERIRQLADESLGVPVSRYRFASTENEYQAAVEAIGCPCVVKPTMSSSGKGQSTVRSMDEARNSWLYAQSGARGAADKVIIEEMIEFDYEITLLTVRHRSGITYCDPIGHRQEGGDYQESWQPHTMAKDVLAECQSIAAKVTEALGGWGIFGVEFFIKDHEIWFSELSPRPHDTGLVTLVSQDLSEFALHSRAILGLPIPAIEFYGPSASAVVTVEGTSSNVIFDNVDAALSSPGVHLRLFGKPSVEGERRMGVVLARGETVDEARQKATESAEKISYTLS